ncbi:MAG TPA: response regulator transcription factor [Bacteroidota bacterium]|nr:response regulator transcription factor [Bacteroidota bacterium]
MRLLLVEDDRSVARSVSRWLRSESFAVDVAPDGLRGEELAGTNDYDAIIMDIMLPGQDGWETLSRIRKGGNLTPILMLTALGGVGDRIRGLETGADDYLAKPFHGGELLARVRALIRRRSEVRSTRLEKFGLSLDLTTHVAARGGKEIPLSAKEFALLELFLMNPGKILSRQKISEHLWDMNFDPKSNVVESFVRFLRRKIDRDFDVPLIHTLRGAGYMLTDRDPAGSS